MAIIGFNSIGTTQYTPQSSWGKNMNRAGQRTAVAGEKITKIHFYGSAVIASPTLRVALFEITSGDGATGNHTMLQMFSFNPTATIGWQTHTLPSAYELTEGKKYAIGFAPGSIAGGKFYATATANSGYSLTGGSNTTWDASTYTTANDNNQTSVYFETEIEVVEEPPEEIVSGIISSPVKTTLVVSSPITTSIIKTSLIR